MKAIDIERQQSRLTKIQQIKKTDYNREDITIDLLEKAEIITAKVIKTYGDIYLPIFIRIQNEIELKKSQHTYKLIALQKSEDDLK